MEAFGNTAQRSSSSLRVGTRAEYPTLFFVCFAFLLSPVRIPLGGFPPIGNGELLLVKFPPTTPGSAEFSNVLLFGYGPALVLRGRRKGWLWWPYQGKQPNVTKTGKKYNKIALAGALIQMWH